MNSYLGWSSLTRYEPLLHLPQLVMHSRWRRDVYGSNQKRHYDQSQDTLGHIVQERDMRSQNQRKLHDWDDSHTSRVLGGALSRHIWRVGEGCDKEISDETTRYHSTLWIEFGAQRARVLKMSFSKSHEGKGKFYEYKMTWSLLELHLLSNSWYSPLEHKIIPKLSFVLN